MPGQSLKTPPLFDFLKSEATHHEYVPTEWKESVSRTLKVIEEDREREANEITEDDVKTIDRFFIEGYGDFTLKFVYHLAVSAREHEFGDCYEDENILNPSSEPVIDKVYGAMQFDNFDQHQAVKSPKIGEEYKWDASEEMMAMLDKKATREHEIRLSAIAAASCESVKRAWVNDYDIRFRKSFPRNHPRSIATEFGVEYLFFRFMSPDPFVSSALGGNFMSTWLKVGCLCALDSCSKRNPELRCEKCKEAHYCNGEHQKSDWHRHKLICKK
jgi:hypothetical protein